MDKTRALAAVLVATLAAAGSAAAQEQQPAAGAQPAVVSLRPADPARWDAAFLVGWAGANRTGVGPEWDDWSDAASFDVSTAHYWTPHVRLELGVAATTEGRVFSQQPVFIPGQPFPHFVSREHLLRTVSVAAGIGYQFLENTWFHPFVGVGVEVGREMTRVRIPIQFLPPRDPGQLPVPTPGSTEEDASAFARPFATVGFKWYVSERAFIRSDIRTAASGDGVESVTWRGGIGFDF